MDCIVRGGVIYDGTGSLPRKADVIVQNGKIAQITKDSSQCPFPVIDARDCVVTPGFVDIHRHCDAAVSTGKGFGELELMQGITSTIVGNCGLAPVPLRPKSDAEFLQYIEPVIGKAPSSNICASFAEYSKMLKNTRLPINMGYLAAMGAVRFAVKGFAQTPFTQTELALATALLGEAMNEGARGVSLGIMYRPECYNTSSEYDALVSCVAKRGGVLCTHIKGEGDSLVQSIAQAIDIASRAQIPLEISHFKATGIHNWHDKIFKAIELIENARAKGQSVTADFYPYDGGATTLLSLLPPTLYTMPTREFATAKGRELLRNAIYCKYADWDNMVTSIGWERIIISSVSRPEDASLQGKSFADAAKNGGYADAADLMSYLLAANGGNVSVIVMSMAWEDVKTVAKLPYTSLISDALYGGGSPHPRLYGAFPKMIRKLVIEDKIMPLEQAIYKMTKLPSNVMRLANIGELAQQNTADIAVFCPQDIQDNATFENPCQYAAGIRHLFVNGEQAICDGKLAKVGAGRFL